MREPDVPPVDAAALDADADHDALAPAPPGLVARRPDDRDFDAVVDLYARSAVRADDGSTGRGALRTRDDLAATWAAGRGDAVVLGDADAGVVGYLEFREVLDPWVPALDLVAEGRVDPAHRRRGIGEFLVVRAVDRAQRAAARTPDLPTELRTTVVDPEPFVVPFFTGRGFTVVRHLLQLRLDLTAATPAPVWPEGVTPVPWERVAPRRLHTALREAFADHHLGVADDYDTWRVVALAGQRVQPPASVVAVDRDGRVAGMALGRVGTPDHPRLGVVSELGVLPAHRGAGLATALLREAFARFRAAGATRAGLEVDDVTLDGALRLYQRAGMEVVHHTVLLSRPTDPT